MKMGGKGHSSTRNITSRFVLIVICTDDKVLLYVAENFSEVWKLVIKKKKILMQQIALISFLTFQGSFPQSEMALSWWMQILCESSFLLLHFSEDSFGSTGLSPDAFRVRWFKHVCTRSGTGLCEANYSWKQLLSWQLASSQSRIMLL